MIALGPHQPSLLTRLRQSLFPDADLQITATPVVASDAFLAHHGVEARQRIQSQRRQRLQAVPLVTVRAVPCELGQPSPDADVKPGGDVQWAPRVEQVGQRLPNLAWTVERRMSGGDDAGIAPGGARAELCAFEDGDLNSASSQRIGSA